MPLIYRYRKPAITEAEKNELLSHAITEVSGNITDIETEYCFYVESSEDLSGKELGILRWLLSETFEPDNYSENSFLREQPSSLIVEVGPRMNFTTSWSTNAVSVCRSCGLTKISRIERSRRYKLSAGNDLGTETSKKMTASFLPLVHDRMTECHYPERLLTFETGVRPKPVFTVPLIEEGKDAL
ncbi:MAG TPA: phosphoribosylformylglycinamidine synthase, partial [Nitrospirae bacterium]|nr:phosphoribosylformylglycinamidine synthase [Nitrospirota bacterium]